MASIFIDLAAQFTGDSAFRKADKATDKLSKNVKHLGQALGLALSAGAMLSFAKASVKAAAEDERAQKQLALALQNVGLGRDVAASEAYISKLSKEFGVVDDQLRPAYQTLAVATKDTAESQKLLQLSLDISASTGKDLSVVSSALSKAYLGNNTALSKLGIGISKADLKAGKFDDIINQLSKTFNGAASKGADTFSGKMARLSVSIDNAKEILGKGLIDSFMILTDSAGIEDLQTKIETFATAAAEQFKKLAGFVKNNLTLLKTTAAVLATMFVTAKITAGVIALVKLIETITLAMKALRATAIGAYIAEMFVLNPLAGLAAGAVILGVIALTIKKLNDLENAAKEASTVSLFPGVTTYDGYLDKVITKTKKLTAEELKQLNAKKLALAIAKANLALGKSSDVFDINKIQLAAAEKNQAEQLGKVTNQAQLLQITNDMARLKVKEDIANLEDAIAAKDIKAIEAGTAKLNKDLGILGALNGQELKLRDIESILKDIVPKDLINLKNLDEAIAKLRLLGSGVITPVGSPTPTATATGTGSMSLLDMLAAGSFVSSGGKGGSINAGNYASSGFPSSDKGYGSGTTVNVNVEAGLGDPNAIAETVTKVIQDAIDRGTLRTLSAA